VARWQCHREFPGPAGARRRLQRHAEAGRVHAPRSRADPQHADGGSPADPDAPDGGSPADPDAPGGTAAAGHPGPLRRAPGGGADTASGTHPDADLPASAASGPDRARTGIGGTLFVLSADREGAREVDDEPTFDEFVATSAGRLLRTAVFLVYDRHLAEDLLQTTYERVARRWTRIMRGGHRPEAYARKVLVNLAIDDNKRRKRRPDVPVGGAFDIDRLAGARQARDAGGTPLDDVLATLPVKQRAVVVLRYWCDLSEHEIAEVLGISRGTVKSHTARAMTALRRQLAEEEAVHE
jgi:RNA polymerase sigma-70 factor (sigma-E family)